MDNNDEPEGCSTLSLGKNASSGTLRPKYAGLKGFKKFQQEMARRKAANISRELPTSVSTTTNSSNTTTTTAGSVTFNDVPMLLVEGCVQNETTFSDSSSAYKKPNGDISFNEGQSLQRNTRPTFSSTTTSTHGSSNIAQSKILERPSPGGFINMDDDSGESEEYECRCHLQQSNNQPNQNYRTAQNFPSSRPSNTSNVQQQKYQSGMAQRSVHYSIDMEKNGEHLPTDASSSQSEEHVHHLSVTFDVISHPPPPSSPLSPNIVANAICPPPPLINEPVIADSRISTQSKYHQMAGTSSAGAQEVSNKKWMFNQVVKSILA